MKAPTKYQDDLVREFEKEVTRLGVTESSEPAKVLAKRAALGVAAEGIWEDAIGPLLTTRDVGQLLGVSRQALSQKANEGQILRLRDERNQIRYPAWQFNTVTQRVFDAVPRVCSIFQEADVDPWMAASFFTTGQPELDGQPPFKLLRENNTFEIEDAARRTCETLAR